MKNKKGSSTVLLSMVFVSLMISITSAITIARALVVKSECEVFGHVWTKAVLSEYDRNLFNDYNIMAYWGNEAEVQKKVNSYLQYSAASKLDASIGKTAAELNGYELGDVSNFRKAIRQSFVTSAADSIADSSKRSVRTSKDGEYGKRAIRNPVVLDTMPSNGVDESYDEEGLVKKIKKGNYLDQLLDSSKNAGAEMMLLTKYMGNHVTAGELDDTFLMNEWEYIIHGNMSDENNYKYCRNVIFLIRNAANLAFIYSSTEKMEVIACVAECLTPGVAGILTTAVIAEAWAAAETELDMKTLMEGGKVPFVKTNSSWKTGITSIIQADDFTQKLDEESKTLLAENDENIRKLKGAKAGSSSGKGQTYDDYLLALMMMENDDQRLLRIMDVIQINMKYRHYRDFNMMEYFTGVRFTIAANAKNYEFEDCYK